MTKVETKDALYPNCPIRNVLSRIGDKWSMLVLFTLENQSVLRFKELKRGIPDISQKMLTSTLRTLEADGLVRRHIYPEMPPRVEYYLSDRGKTLIPHINSLIYWAEENMENILDERRKYLIKD